MTPRSETLTASGKPRLAIYTRHSLIDGRGPAHLVAPGNERGHISLGPWPHNVGDQFVAAGLARALDCDEFYTLSRDATPEQFELVNRECHAVIFIAQNSLTPGWYEREFPLEALKKLKIPMILSSLGLQFQYGDEIALTDGDVRSLKYIHDHCDSSQVRGHMSAELLSRYGINNTRILGCPSLLYPGKRNLPVRDANFSDVGFTITDMGQIPKSRAFQFKVMEDVFRHSDRFTTVGQGGEYSLQAFITARDGIHPSERHDYWLERNEAGEFKEIERLNYTRTVTNEAVLKSYIETFDTEQLEADVRWYYRDLSPNLIDNIIERAFFGAHMSEFIRRGRDASLYVGTRLHGNLMALMQGTPSVFVLHDYRMKDMAEFLRLPHIAYCDQPVSISEVTQKGAWQEFESLLPELWDGFREFFEENGLTHNLNREDKPKASRPS